MNAEKPTRILVVCKGGVGSKMSSPGIRSLNIARVLARGVPNARVLLAVPGSSDLVPDAPFRVVSYSTRTLPRLARGADIVICSGYPPTLIPAFFGRRFVMDFFANFAIEGLEYRIDQVSPLAREQWLDTQRVYLNLQLTLADFVICANQRQRDAWLGMMSILGLIPGSVYDRDNTLNRLVGVAPYGVRPEEPVLPATGARSSVAGDGSHMTSRPGQPSPVVVAPQSFGSRISGQPNVSELGPHPPAEAGDRPVVRGVIPGIGADDQLLIWNGGILGWYDPLTLIRAVGRLAPTHPRLRLLFLGTAYPVAGFDPGGTLGEAYALAESLGLLGRSVIFNGGWLDYDDSGRAVLEADIGVSTYYDNLETHFSFRTRLVDFLWAGVPIVCTHGDVIAALVAERGLGLVAPEEDEEALAAALARLLDDAPFREQCRANIVALRDALTWEQTLAPLVEFCRQPDSVARGKWSRAPEVAGRAARYMQARVLEQLATRAERLRDAVNESAGR